MAWVEAAVVFYLRTMVNRIEPYQPTPLPLAGGLGTAEFVREAATLVMLATTGILAGRNWRCRIGYAAIAFGVWDILYYVFLKLLCGWPHALADWDILFLIPLPWWGPVWAPVAIALLMIIWGTLVTQFPRPGKLLAWAPWMLNATGVALALYVFMQDALRVHGQGLEALREMLPSTFSWKLFALALLLISAPIVDLCRRLRRARQQERVQAPRPPALAAPACRLPARARARHGMAAVRAERVDAPGVNP